MLDDILNKVSKTTSKKCAVSFQMKKELKNKIDKICHDNEISFTSFMIAMIENTLVDYDEDSK